MKRRKKENKDAEWPKVGDRVRPFPGIPQCGVGSPLDLPEGSTGVILAISRRDPFRPRYTIKWDTPPSEHPGQHIVMEGPA